MTEREQWRFQWPDGTWIRWNPNTQAWEKEEQDGGTGDVVSTSGPSEPPAPPADVDHPTAGTGGSPRGLIGSQAANESYVPVDEAEELPDEEPRVPAQVREAPRRVRARRAGVDDVIPPRAPERPGGAWWPTILAGALLGIAVGLVIWIAIR